MRRNSMRPRVGPGSPPVVHRFDYSLQDLAMESRTVPAATACRARAGGRRHPATPSSPPSPTQLGRPRRRRSCRCPTPRPTAGVSLRTVYHHFPDRPRRLTAVAEWAEQPRSARSPPDRRRRRPRRPRPAHLRPGRPADRPRPGHLRRRRRATSARRRRLRGRPPRDRRAPHRPRRAAGADHPGHRRRRPAGVGRRRRPARRRPRAHRGRGRPRPRPSRWPRSSPTSAPGAGHGMMLRREPTLNASSTSSWRSPGAPATSTSTTTRRHVIRLDRRLFSATVYPADYGFIPDTLGEDGDPLDALVLLDDPTFPGCWVASRPVGVFWMEDDKGPDAKIICVPGRRPPVGRRAGDRGRPRARCGPRSSTSSTSTRCSSPTSTRTPAATRARDRPGPRSRPRSPATSRTDATRRGQRSRTAQMPGPRSTIGGS